MLNIGVLAIQGDVTEHKDALSQLRVTSTDVRLPTDLERIDGLIIPGGESTTMMQLIDTYHLRAPLIKQLKSGKPVWGTCAGLIALANQLTEKRPKPLELMNITVSRNAYGRQVNSFETDLDIECVSEPPFKAVFIRAPKITEVGPEVEILSRLFDGQPVAVRQSNMLGTSFHPELTDDLRIHKLFVNIVENSIMAPMK